MRPEIIDDAAALLAVDRVSAEPAREADQNFSEDDRLPSVESRCPTDSPLPLQVTDPRETKIPTLVQLGRLRVRPQRVHRRANQNLDINAARHGATSARLSNSASRINASTAMTNRRTGGTRNASAADGSSCCVSDTSDTVAR